MSDQTSEKTWHILPFDGIYARKNKTMFCGEKLVMGVTDWLYLTEIVEDSRRLVCRECWEAATARVRLTAEERSDE